jgi:hypothetical protein
LHQVALEVQQAQSKSHTGGLPSHADVVLALALEDECHDYEVFPEAGEGQVFGWELSLVHEEDGLEAMDERNRVFEDFAI